MNLSQYEKQVKLMLECFPQIFPSSFFALKGGTAINFFERNMPRLSVDIDLSYFPLEDRKTTLKNIETELKNIAKKIDQKVPQAKATMNSLKTKNLKKHKYLAHQLKEKLGR